jgi:hypothetical protein
MTPIRPKRPTTLARAAAARANGAKSRGPVSIRGKANSSHNSFLHGLRSRRPLFTDAASMAALAATLEAWERDIQPQSGIERHYMEKMAVADWRGACLFKLEATTAHTSPQQKMSFLTALYRLDARYHRHFDNAYRALTEHRTLVAEWPGLAKIREKQKWDPRTPEPIENTEPLPAPIALSAGRNS